MSERHPKRQRKKEAAAARRAAMIAAAEKRRRQRVLVIALTVGALIVGGGALALVATLGGDEEKKPAASASPTPTPAGSPAPIACDGRYPAAAGSQKPTFEKAEDQKLGRNKTYILKLDTSCGEIQVKLDHGKSPKTVNSVVFLARKGFYDGLTFHRIAKDFVIQGGDPAGNGTGGSGYKVTEAPPKGTKYTKGVVAMAKAGNEPAGTSGSQFFIVSGGANPGLPAEYAVLGNVLSGIDVVDRINGLAPAGGDTPEVDIYIEKATVLEQ